MTLVVHISRSQEFALAISDVGYFALNRDDPDDEGTLVTATAEPRKAYALTDNVIASVGGCAVIGSEFRELIARRVAASDDLEACRAAAQATIDELIAVDGDRAGKVVEHIDGPARRYSIFECCSITLNGFGRDGTTAIVQWREGVGMDYADPAGEFVSSRPFGVGIRDIARFYEGYENLDLGDALAHAFSVPFELGQKYPDRISREIHLTGLIWRDVGERPAILTATLDREDVDSLESVRTCTPDPSSCLSGAPDRLTAVRSPWPDRVGDSPRSGQGVSNRNGESR